VKLRFLVLAAVAFAVLLTLGMFGWNVASHCWVSHTNPESPSMKDLLTPQADVKWRAAGTGAVPVLVNALAKQTGLLDIAYSNAWARMPVSIQSNLPAPIDSKTIRMAAAGLLADPKIGTNIPIPALTNALMDKSWPVRFNVLACLANVVLPNAGSEKAQLLPQILMASTDPEMMVRMQAFNCLGFYKEQSEEIVPTLTKALGTITPMFAFAQRWRSTR